MLKDKRDIPGYPAEEPTLERVGDQPNSEKNIQEQDEELPPFMYDEELDKKINSNKEWIDIDGTRYLIREIGNA